MLRVSRFLLWCAGTDPDSLGPLRSERIKQSCIGALVPIPAAMSVPAMSFALSTLTANPWVHIPLGLAWGALVIFPIDRFLVATYRKRDSLRQELRSLCLRLILAAGIGLTIAHPLLLWIYRDSIAAEIQREEKIHIDNVGTHYEARINQLQQELNQLHADVSALEAKRRENQELTVLEVAGIKVAGQTTGREGRWLVTVAREKMTEMLGSDLVRLRERTDRREEEIVRQMRDLNTAWQHEKMVYQAPRDYLAQTVALEHLTQKFPPVRIQGWFLVLFLMLVDSVAVLAKAVATRGPYDDRLAVREFEESLKIRAEREALTNTCPLIVEIRAQERLSRLTYQVTQAHLAAFADLLEELNTQELRFIDQLRKKQERLRQIAPDHARDWFEKVYLNRLIDTFRAVVERTLKDFQSAVKTTSGGATGAGGKWN